MSPLSVLADVTPPVVDWRPVLDLLLGPAGLTVGLLLVVFAFAREWVVPGSRYRRETDELKSMLTDLREPIGDIAKATESRNRNEQARLDLLRGSHGLSGDLTEAEEQITTRRRRP